MANNKASSPQASQEFLAKVGDGVTPEWAEEIMNELLVKQQEFGPTPACNIERFAAAYLAERAAHDASQQTIRELVATAIDLIDASQDARCADLRIVVARMRTAIDAVRSAPETGAVSEVQAPGGEPRSEK